MTEWEVLNITLCHRFTGLWYRTRHKNVGGFLHNVADKDYIRVIFLFLVRPTTVKWDSTWTRQVEYKSNRGISGVRRVTTNQNDLHHRQPSLIYTGDGDHCWLISMCVCTYANVSIQLKAQLSLSTLESDKLQEDGDEVWHGGAAGWRCPKTAHRTDAKLTLTLASVVSSTQILQSRNPWFYIRAVKKILNARKESFFFSCWFI